MSEFARIQGKVAPSAELPPAADLGPALPKLPRAQQEASAVVPESEARLRAVERVTIESPNFRVHCSDPELGRRVAGVAEIVRRCTPKKWFGEELPNWDTPAEVTVYINDEAVPGELKTASGVTSCHRPPGSKELQYSINIRPDLGGGLAQDGSILASVLPHEIGHAILATRFKSQINPWYGEGMVILMEGIVGGGRDRDLISGLHGGKGFPMYKLFDLAEYPKQDVGMFYAQAASVIEFLSTKHGEKRLLEMGADVIAKGQSWQDWEQGIQKYYGYKDINALSTAWLDWVDAGQGGRSRQRFDQQNLLTVDYAKTGVMDAPPISLHEGPKSSLEEESYFPSQVPAEQLKLIAGMEFTTPAMFRGAADTGVKIAITSKLRDSGDVTDSLTMAIEILGSIREPKLQGLLVEKSKVVLSDALPAITNPDSMKLALTKLQASENFASHFLFAMVRHSNNPEVVQMLEAKERELSSR